MDRQERLRHKAFSKVESRQNKSVEKNEENIPESFSTQLLKEPTIGM